MTRPEQSNETPGFEVPHTYETPTCDRAADTMVDAAPELTLPPEELELLRELVLPEFVLVLVFEVVLVF